VGLSSSKLGQIAFGLTKSCRVVGSMNHENHIIQL